MHSQTNKQNAPIMRKVICIWSFQDKRNKEKKEKKITAQNIIKHFKDENNEQECQRIPLWSETVMEGLNQEGHLWSRNPLSMHLYDINWVTYWRSKYVLWVRKHQKFTCVQEDFDHWSVLRCAQNIWHTSTKKHKNYLSDRFKNTKTPKDIKFHTSNWLTIWLGRTRPFPSKHLFWL